MRMRHPGNPEQTDKKKIKRNRTPASAQQAPTLRRPPFLKNSAEIEQPNRALYPHLLRFTVYESS